MRSRRENDALKPLPSDIGFVREIKRFAQALDWTTVDLAEKFEVEVSTIHRHLRTRRRPHLDTVLRYAHVLNVPEAYLRIVAGYADDKRDTEPAVGALVMTFEALTMQVSDRGLREVWRRFLSSPHYLEVLAMVYVDSLRRQAEAAVGLVQEGDVRGLLVNELARIGIDVSPYRVAKPDLAYRIALALSVELSDEDIRAVLSLIEQRRASRGEDIRSFRRERKGFEKNGLRNYIERIR